MGRVSLDKPSIAHSERPNVIYISSTGFRDAQDARRVAELAERHADLKLGIADAHTMVLAAPERYGTTRVLTFDHKHFRAVKPPQGGVFTVLPADL
jgi:predicted nucleic acid-binding protein